MCSRKRKPFEINHSASLETSSVLLHEFGWIELDIPGECASGLCSRWKVKCNIGGFVQDFSNSIATALGGLQSVAKSSIWLHLMNPTTHVYVVSVAVVDSWGIFTHIVLHNYLFSEYKPPYPLWTRGGRQTVLGLYWDSYTNNPASV